MGQIQHGFDVVNALVATSWFRQSLPSLDYGLASKNSRLYNVRRLTEGNPNIDMARSLADEPCVLFINLQDFRVG